MDLDRRVSATSSEDGDDIPDIECSLCKVKFSGVQPYENHLEGKKHRKMAIKMQTEKRLLKMNQNHSNGGHTLEDEALYATIPNIKPYAHCDICKKAFSGPEGQHQHLISQAHKKKVGQAKIKEEVLKKNSDPQTHIVIKEEIDEDDLLQEFAQCKVCEKSFNNPISLSQHVKSANHQRKVKEMDKEGDMQTYTVDPEEASLGFKYKCKACDASFRDVTSLERHLSSQSHGKQKQKKEIVEFLSKYPELRLVPSKNIKVSDQQEGEANDDPKYYPLELQSDFFVCKVCSCSFSGPGNAKEHVLSKKHAKNKVASELQSKLINVDKNAAEFSGNSEITAGVAKSFEFPTCYASMSNPQEILEENMPNLSHKDDDFEIV